MATGNEYRQFILDQLADVPGIRMRPMMGEYLLYVREKLVGGLYDDRLLVKKVPAAQAMLPTGREHLPYEGAKPMLRVEEVDDSAFLTALMERLCLRQRQKSEIEQSALIKEAGRFQKRNKTTKEALRHR